MLIKETLTSDNENLAERLSLKLVRSIRYYYSLEKPVAITAQIIRKVITATTGFVAGSIPHTVLAKIKRKEEKERASTSIFGSFLGKLSKGKGYISVKDPTKVDDLNQTFKVFEGKAFNKEIHTLADTSDILGSLSGKESLELERVNQVTKDYNLRSRFRSLKAIRTSLPVVQKKKIPKLVVLSPLIVLIVPVVPVVPINQPLISDGDGRQTVINTL